MGLGWDPVANEVIDLGRYRVLSRDPVTRVSLTQNDTDSLVGAMTLALDIRDRGRIATVLDLRHDKYKVLTELHPHKPNRPRHWALPG